MRIVDVKSYIVGNPPPHRGGLNWVFLKLVTDEGIEGWGECPSPWLREHTCAQLIQELSKRFVIGQDPFDVERIWESVHNKSVVLSQYPNDDIAYASSERAQG